MHCPHTSEVPFIFGTTSAAEAHVGGGSDIQPLTEHDGGLGVLCAAWKPDNSTVPAGSRSRMPIGKR